MANRISMALEEDQSSFWYLTTELTNYFYTCGDSIDPSCDIVPKMQNISRSVISNTRVSQHKGFYKRNTDQLKGSQSRLYHRLIHNFCIIITFSFFYRFENPFPGLKYTH